MDQNYKTDMGDHFDENLRQAVPLHCSKIFKTNLKTHISPLLNSPKGPGARGIKITKRTFK